MQSSLCENPVIFTVEELRSTFEVITVPVTIVCAGNRRKEQNVVQKSLGFSWGAAGLSTALFTGVRLADVLDYVRPNRQAKHVVFEGSDSLPNGPYGTRQGLWLSYSSELADTQQPAPFVGSRSKKRYDARMGDEWSSVSSPELLLRKYRSH